MLYCYSNGHIIPSAEATVHISDLGLVRSYAVFDFFRTYGGKPFRMPDYLARFRNSAANLRLPFNLSDEELLNIINLLMTKSELKEAGIKMILTGGESKDTMTIEKPNFFVQVMELSELSEDHYTEGVKLITSDFQREIPVVKSTHYLNAIKLQPLKEKHGAYDVLYCFKGKVLEVPRNNFFLIKNDTLITPKDDVLLGITRKVTLELAQDHFKVEEREVVVDELQEADEAFVTGTTRRMVPVVQIDDYSIGEGRVGEGTKRLIRLFDQYIGEVSI
ncbi:MAG TPA: aminotransferase IV [Flavobacteriales bacterium]|nr:aminotransferase IV [Flavobacteriales bacterium]